MKLKRNLKAGLRKMGTDFKCGCRVSGGWYLCKEHEIVLINLIAQSELNIENIEIIK